MQSQRKFRSLTSDLWTYGKMQPRQRKRVIRKKTEVREMFGKSRDAAFKCGGGGPSPGDGRSRSDKNLGKSTMLK